MTRPPTAPNVAANVRYMGRRDLPEVLAIEQASAVAPWDEDDVRTALRRPPTVAFVAEDQAGAISGFVVFEKNPRNVHVLLLAVRHDARRRGVGGKLLQKALDRCNHERSRATLHCHDQADAAHRFLKAMGFQATRVVREFYERPPGDAYIFTRRFTNAKGGLPDGR